MTRRCSASVLLPAAILGSLGLFVGGCRGRGVPTTARGVPAVLAVALPYDIDPLPPYRNPVLSPAVPWPRLLGRGLVRIDRQGRPSGDLARHMTTPDGGRTWDFELRAEQRLADGRPLTAAVFCALWREQHGQYAGAAWLFRELADGPYPADEYVVRFRLDAVRPLFPRRMSHPWAYLLAHPAGDASNGVVPGPYLLNGTGRHDVTDDRPEGRSRGIFLSPNPSVQESDTEAALLLVRSPTAGGALLLRLGDVRAARLEEHELAAAGQIGAAVSCARPAIWYALVLQSAGVGDPDSALRRQLERALDRARLVRRAVPATGRVWTATGRPLTDVASAVVDGAAASRAGARISMLVDVDDRVGVALADHIQADLLDGGIDLRVDAVRGLAYDRRLRAGQYGLALAGFRNVFDDPGLDLLAWVRAAGFRTRALEDGLDDLLALPAGSRRRRAVARLTATIEQQRLWIPLVAVDECWSHARDLEVEDLATLTSAAPRRFETRRPERAR